ncbi:MAG: MBL fold metallo-hydrolase [Desulfococcaceae bacterium]
MKITDEIFQVGGSGFTSPEDAAIYLICFDGHAALVDAGCGYDPERLLANIRLHGVLPEKTEYLLLTHCHFDHTGGAAFLREHLHCQVVMHEADALFLEQGNSSVTAASWYGACIKSCTVDRKLAGNREDILLGERKIQAIHIPGHSPGSLAFFTESQGLKVLFGQDVHGPLAPALLSNGNHYRISLEILLSLEADILCEGHYGVFRGKDAVAKFIRSFLR